MEDVLDRSKVLFTTFKLNLPGGIEVSPNYWQAGAILVLLFLLILTMGQLRHRLLDWHMKGFFPGIAFGFMLALIMEGFLIIGGRTALSSVFGWDNPPRLVGGAIDNGRNKLVQVLGEQIEIPESVAQGEIDARKVYELYINLEGREKAELYGLMCGE